MVCADFQIHSEEMKALNELANQGNKEHNIVEMEKILAQDENHLSLPEVAKRVPPAQQMEAMQQLLAIACVDGFFSPLEQEMVEQIAQIWNWPNNRIEQIINQAENFLPVQSSDNNDERSRLSWAAWLLKNIDKFPFLHTLLAKGKKLAPETIGRKIEQIEREILLYGPEYNEAIQHCAKIASEDYQFAELALHRTESALSDLAENLQQASQRIDRTTKGKGQANNAKDVAKQLEISIEALNGKIIKELEKIEESLRAKQRAINHFSIAFMGKTKAGKSTLHAIITGEGWNAIGVGKQRTTRLNRVYEWKNIRIIDTPGIGAPGGKSDEEIAQSVIDESDVICYIVTNDSIQESEFQFLKLLKDKAKPLIVLLNVKYNLCDSRRLEHFLNNPNKMFAMEGNSGLQGHFDRIRRYAKQYYANDYFPIVPVMLLAAQMSTEPEHQEHKDKLFKASRIQDFLDSIRESLIKHGAIRRSQTLLGSTVGAIADPNKWITQQTQVYQQLTNTLKTKRQKIDRDIQIAQRDALEYLQKEIEEVFQEAFKAIPSFAEEHWNATENQMDRGWQRTLKAIRFEERLKNSYGVTSEKFKDRVQESIEEVGRELELIAQLGSGSFSFREQDSFDLKNVVKIGGTVLTIAGSLLMFTPLAPVGIVIGFVGAIAGIVSWFFTSKEQKRREAVNKISNSLHKQMARYIKEIIGQSQNNFNSYSADINSHIQNYFDDLIYGLESIGTQLQAAKNKLDDATNYLNRAYAKRIVDWCLRKYEPLTDLAINTTIAKVDRDFGRSMTIYPKVEIILQKSQPDEIKQVLQEDVSFAQTEDLK
jgi:GTP-binding protein EngB required for normal cell division